MYRSVTPVSPLLLLGDIALKVVPYFLVPSITCFITPYGYVAVVPSPTILLS